MLPLTYVYTRESVLDALRRRVYDKLLWALLVNSALTIILLFGSGPYPNVPEWFYGATYDAGVHSLQSAVVFV